MLAARGERSLSVDEAMATLCETYWYPLYAFLRGRGRAPDEAEDLTQAFFVRVLEKGTLNHVDPARGRFRSFLLTSLQNFASNEHDRQMAAKRHSGTPLLSLDVETAEGRFQIEPPTDETPERVFDRRWALTLLDRVLVRLRDEWIRRGNVLRFEHLKVYLPAERIQGGYAQAAATLGMSEGAVRQEVLRLRRHFHVLLKDEIAHTVSSPEEIDEEIRYLWSAVRR